MFPINLRGYTSIANIQNLLEDPKSTTLETILEEGDVIQEFHSSNELLIALYVQMSFFVVSLILP